MNCDIKGTLVTSNDNDSDNDIHCLGNRNTNEKCDQWSINVKEDSVLKNSSVGLEETAVDLKSPKLHFFIRVSNLIKDLGNYM